MISPSVIKTLIGSYLYSHSKGRGGQDGLGLLYSNVLECNSGFEQDTRLSFKNHSIFDGFFQEKSLNLWSMPTLFKYFFWNNHLINTAMVKIDSIKWAVSSIKLSDSLTFSSKLNFFKKTNLTPLPLLNYSIKRTVLKIMANDIYIPRTTTFFYKTLVNFIEFHTGRRVLIKFDSYITSALPFADVCRCSLWYNKVNMFQKMLGHRIFVQEGVKVIVSAVRFKDPTFFSNWIKAMLYRMSFWKYRLLFRYIRYVFRSLLQPQFEHFGFRGLKIVIRGKISVAGNARTRTLRLIVGNTSHAEMNNRVLSSFTNIHSFTGVMGFRLSFFF